jgi:hypothetical protein
MDEAIPTMLNVMLNVAIGVGFAYEQLIFVIRK